jgi:uncharacterized protein
MVKSENELALSPNTMFKVVASYTSEHLKDLRGFCLFFHCDLFSCNNFFFTTFFAGLLNIPDKVDMIVLQEIDLSDPAQAPSDTTSPYRRRHKPTIDAANTAITTLQDVETMQPPPQDLGQAISQQLVDVDFSETDSAASDSESVDLQHQQALQAPSDTTTPSRRRHKPTIDAANTAITTLQDVETMQPPPQDLGQAISQQLVDVDFSETDSAASDSESVDLQHQHALQAPSDTTSPSRRRHKPTIDAANTAITTLQDVETMQPPPQDLGQAISQQLVDVDFSETDSAASDSESVDLQHQHAHDNLDDEHEKDC